jgi:hypothetical protein
MCAFETEFSGVYHVRINHDRALREINRPLMGSDGAWGFAAAPIVVRQPLAPWPSRSWQHMGAQKCVNSGVDMVRDFGVPRICPDAQQRPERDGLDD